MIQFNVIPEEHKAVVRFPKEARMPDKTIKVYSWDQAHKKWESECQEFVYHSLRKWVLQRNVAYKVAGELTPKRASNIDRLLLMLVRCETWPLVSLCRKVVEHYEDFVSLFPSKYSKNVDWTRQVIAPILLWCQEYRNQMDGRS